MAAAESFHYFRVHFVVQPGGSRKTEYHVVGRFREAQEAIMGDLSSGEGAYHAVFYGEDILLQCWHDGTKLAQIDLHPMITYRIEGLGELRFPGEGNAPLIGFDDERFDDEQMETQMESLIEEELDIEVTIDWDAVKAELPAMEGRPLPPGHDAPFENGRRWAYGLHGDWDHYL